MIPSPGSAKVAIIRGTEVFLPKGTRVIDEQRSAPPVSSTHDQTVTTHRIFHAFDAPEDHGWGHVRGRIFWGGTDGYWYSAYVTPDLMAANPDLDFTNMF